MQNTHDDRSKAASSARQQRPPDRSTSDDTLVVSSRRSSSPDLFQNFEDMEKLIYDEPSLITSSNPKKRSLDDDEPPTFATSPFEPAKARRITKSVRVPVTEAKSPTTPYIIAHSHHLQICFNVRSIAYGVQYEIARLASLEDIPVNKLDQLKGTHASVAQNVARVIGQDRVAQPERDDSPVLATPTAESLARLPWNELDREEGALASENPLAGVGGSADSKAWYGGKVSFTAKLSPTKDSHEPYRVVLNKPELGASYRFARRFGSSSFLRVKVPILNARDNGLMDFFARPFILNGRVFRAFYSKDGTVFMFWTNETVLPSGKISPNFTIAGRLSLLAFLEWHNPLASNPKQTMAKWSARMALGLSNSVPGITIPVENAHEMDDIVSTEGSEMTDGCGFANKVCLIMLRNMLEWDVFPTAIQIRYGGSKGLLLLHPNPNMGGGEHPHIITRNSNVKIKYPPSQVLDRSQTTLDVLRSSHMRVPSRLSVETIINLAENGVPPEVMGRLCQLALEALVAPLMIWEGQDAMRNLWCAIERKGGVISARSVRKSPGESRARGFTEISPDERAAQRDDEREDEDALPDSDSVLREQSVAWWPDERSGCPSTLEETCLVMLDAGFTPQNCAYLREKLRHTVRTTVRTFMTNPRIDVQMSCLAFVCPDPCNVLGPNEVFIKCSRRWLKTLEGLDMDFVTGDVLLTRHPCKLPTDILKFRAVFKPELQFYTDVILCSTQGSRRLLDFLAGGDYDGDKCIAIWEPEIVDSFVNADLKYSVKPPEVEKMFSRDNQTVAEYLDRRPTDVAGQMRGLQRFLLGALNNTSLVGSYSSFHDAAVYHLGYTHPTSIELAYMFTETLDGAKTGLTPLPEVVQKHRKEWGTRAPKWKSDKSTEGDSKSSTPNRPKSLPPFIMDVILRIAREAGDSQLGGIHKRFNELQETVATSGINDADLQKPWLDAVRLADRLEKVGELRQKQTLAYIMTHVQKVYAMHREAIKQTKTSKSPVKSLQKKNETDFSCLPIEERQDVLRAVSKEFAMGLKFPPEFIVPFENTQLDRLKASYAYHHDAKEKKWTRFPFDVAMRTLCAIKAQVEGTHKVVSGEFYEKFTMKRTKVE